jgi:Peptidase family M23
MRRLALVLFAFFNLTAPAHAAWTWPVAGEVITPFRNGTDPYAAGQHRGIDIAAPVGAPVVAAAGGEVRFAGTAGSSGLTIGIRTSDGYDVSYLHLSSLLVQAGAEVSAGQRIGAVGTSGTRSAGAPHLHFGVRTAGSRHDYRDPLAFLPPPAPPAPSERPAPAPTPAPSRPAPAPLPAPARRPLPAPVPAPARRPALRPAPGRAPRAAPGRAPRTAPGRGPRALPRAAPRRAPGRSPIPRRTPGRIPQPVRTPPRALGAAPDPMPAARHPAPAPGRRALPADAGRPALAGPEARAPSAAPGPHAPGGPDVGWALAGAGLLLAAAVLGLTGDGRRSAARGRARLARALRPVLGRH